MRRRSRGTGSEALRAPWRRWTAIIDLFARRRPARRRVNSRAYRALHQELIATCRSLADAADAELRAYYEGLEVLARPWLGPKTLEHADGAILASLLDRCRQVEAELGVRHRFRSRFTWSITPLLVALALAVSLALLLFVDVDPARALDQARGWSDALWFAVRRSSDMLKLAVVTVLVVLGSVYFSSRTSRN